MSRTFAVTGVASGIGAALAKKLKAKGHHVVGYDLKETSANVDDFVPLDLNDPASVAAAAESTPRKLDGLCNNAGVPPRPGMEAAILSINFTATRAFTHAMLPHLNGGASIVNIASRAGHRWRDSLDQVKRFAAISEPDEVARFIVQEQIDATRCYDLSKEAFLLWTLAMSESLGNRGLRINSISPGGVSTDILDDFQRAFGDRMTRNVARAGRPGTAEEIAEVAAFVLSPESNWIKGTDIAIDGGMGAFNMSDALGLEAMRLADPDQ